MMWRTHALSGTNTLRLLTMVPYHLLMYDFGTLAVCAALGALMPDLDAREAKIKHLSIIDIKPFFVAAQVVHNSDRHRGMMHSLSGLSMMILLVFPFSYWTGWAPVTALLLGYGSHLIADGCTKSGIPLLYPRQQRYHALPRPWRITTGSLAEEMLLPLLATVALLLLITHKGSVSRCISCAD